jgi:hypothetical protein
VSLRTFDTEDDIELFGEFYEPGTNRTTPVDPGTVEVTIRKPDDTTTTPSVTRLDVGRYMVTVTPEPEEYGTWWYRFHGSGSVQANQERKFKVREPQVG